MTTYKDLCARAGELAKLLKATTKAAIPDELIRETAETIASVTNRVALFLPPTVAQKRAAKSDPTAVQIAKLTSLDAKRKGFFNAAYFQRRFAALPVDRSLVCAKAPATTAAARDALVLYCYRSERARGDFFLSALQTELEADYQASPEAVAESRAQELLREFMAANDLENLTVRLEAEFPAEKDLKTFTKIAGLKVPPQPRGGKTKKSIYHRVAEEIHQKGAVARMDLDMSSSGKARR